MYDAPNIIVLYNHFIHKEEFASLLFVQLYVNFTDPIAFVELGTGLCN